MKNYVPYDILHNNIQCDINMKIRMAGYCSQFTNSMRTGKS